MTIIEYFDMIDQLNGTLNRYEFCAVTRLFFSCKDVSKEHRERCVKTIDEFHNELDSYLQDNTACKYLQDNIACKNVEVISKSLILEELPIFNETEKEYVAMYNLPSNEQVNIFLIVHLTKL